MKITDGPYAPTRGITLAVLILIALALFVLLGGLTGCAPAPDAALCDQVRAGGLVQTGDNPVTFDVVVNRQIVATDVPLAIIMECK